VQQHREQGLRVPLGWGVDSAGMDTEDPGNVESLLPIGGYKGFGLSMMVDILCGLLTGAPYGPHVSRMFGTPMSDKRLLGHFFMALRIDCFEDPMVFKKRLKEMMDALRREPPRDAAVPVQVPGDPEKAFSRERSRTGIPVPESLANQLSALAREYGVPFEFSSEGSR